MSILKKIFFLSLLIFTLTLLFWGVYTLSFKKEGTAEEKATPEPFVEEPATKSQNGSSAISAVSQESVVSPSLSANGNSIVYFSQSSGELLEIFPSEDQAKSLSERKFPGVVSARWSPDKKKAILKLQEGGGYSFLYYNFLEKTSAPIRENIDEIAWQNTSSKFFYKYFDSKTQKRSINISDSDGKNWKNLADIPYRYVSIGEVPKSGLVSFWNNPDAYSETIFESTPIIGGTKKTIFSQKFGADYLWSPSGANVLLSHSDQKGGSKMQLAVLNYNGGEYKNLNIPTFSSKCVWSKDAKTIYYALPGNIPEGAILPNDYQKGQFQTVDTFWKVDIETGEKTRIVEPNEIKEKYDAADIFLNQDESMLFFMNKIDKKIYKINL